MRTILQWVLIGFGAWVLCLVVGGVWLLVERHQPACPPRAWWETLLDKAEQYRCQWGWQAQLTRPMNIADAGHDPYCHYSGWNGLCDKHKDALPHASWLAHYRQHRYRLYRPKLQPSGYYH